MNTKTSIKDYNSALKYHDVFTRLVTRCVPFMLLLLPAREKSSLEMRKIHSRRNRDNGAVDRPLETSFLLHNKGEMARGSQLFNLPIPTTASKIAGYLK
jgi:hypothetical protein